jgi:hypothetical protein
MALVRFATTCDKPHGSDPQPRSTEYESWPECRECGCHVCPACECPNERSDDETNKTLCCDCGGMLIQ